MKHKKGVMVFVLILLSFVPFIYTALPAYAADVKQLTKKPNVFISVRGALLYHKPSCLIVKDIDPANELVFKTKAAAEKAGFKPCGRCDPQ
jgi:hypothetical protein